MAENTQKLARKLIAHKKDVELVKIDNQMEMIDALETIAKNTTPESKPEKEEPEQVVVDFSDVLSKLEILTDEVKKKAEDDSDYILEINEEAKAKLKGDSGEKGEKGDRGEKGDKGDIPTVEELTTLLEAILPSTEPFIPETAEALRDKLETLKEDERLDVSAIKGLDKFSDELITKVRGFIPSRSGGGVTSITSSDGSVQISSSMAKGKGVVDLKVTTSGGGTPATTVVDETTAGQSPAVGVSTDYARADHTHGTPALPTPSDIGLGNVDNTSDANKPISTATQSALDLKLNISDVINGDSFGLVVDGGGSAITTGSKGTRYIPFDCIITGWDIRSDISGNVVVDVKRSGVSLAGTEKPTLSGATSNQDLVLSTWTTSLLAGDVIEFVIDSASTLTRATLTMLITKI